MAGASKRIKEYISHGVVAKGDVAAVARALDAIREAKNSVGIGPRDVLDAATDPASPLHRYFEWDDTKAAARFRIQQARDVLQSVEVVLEDDDRVYPPARMFVSCDPRTHATASESYVPVQFALNDTERRTRMLTSALREIEAWQKRYDTLIELAGIHAAVEVVRDTLRQSA